MPTRRKFNLISTWWRSPLFWTVTFAILAAAWLAWDAPLAPAAHAQGEPSRAVSSDAPRDDVTPTTARAPNVVPSTTDPAAASSARVLRIGVQSASLPFAYKDMQGQYRGYSVDICRKVVEALRAQTDPTLASLDVEYVPITSKTRIPMLLAGDIDLECGSTSNTAARRALGVAFSPTIFVSDVAVLMSQGLAADARSAATWTERLHQEPRPTLVTTAGSTSVRHLRELLRMSGGKAKVVYGASHDDSFRKLEVNEADAFVMDRSLLASKLAGSGWMAKSGHTLSSWSVAHDELECYGLMMRDGGSALDVALKEAAEKVVQAMMLDGSLRELHRLWFEQPLDPAVRPHGMRPDVVLGETMSFAMRRQLAHPKTSVCEREAVSPELVARASR